MDNKTNSGYLYSDNAENHCYSEEDFMSFEFSFVLRIKDKPELGEAVFFYTPANL